MCAPTGDPAAPGSVTQRIPEHLCDFWLQIVAEGDTACEKYNQARNLPCTPTTADDPAFLKALQEPG